MGKSTFLKAMAGRPSPGIDVLIGTVAIASISRQTLVSTVTLVAQDAYVFDGTIRDNLSLADPVASETDMWAVLDAVALEDTVTSFPLGLNTPVGPGGEYLSGGQRRRLSVAQGLLRRPRVLLLDEPTSSLDNLTASRLVHRVRRFDPTAILVLAIHDRQLAALDWEPTWVLDLEPIGPCGNPSSLREDETLGRDGLEMIPSCQIALARERIQACRSLS